MFLAEWRWNGGDDTPDRSGAKQTPCRDSVQFALLAAPVADPVGIKRSRPSQDAVASIGALGRGGNRADWPQRASDIHADRPLGDGEKLQIRMRQVQRCLAAPFASGPRRPGRLRWARRRRSPTFSARSGRVDRGLAESGTGRARRPVSSLARGAGRREPCPVGRRHLCDNPRWSAARLSMRAAWGVRVNPPALVPPRISSPSASPKRVGTSPDARRPTPPRWGIAPAGRFP